MSEEVLPNALDNDGPFHTMVRGVLPLITQYQQASDEDIKRNIADNIIRQLMPGIKWYASTSARNNKGLAPMIDLDACEEAATQAVFDGLMKCDVAQDVRSITGFFLQSMYNKITDMIRHERAAKRRPLRSEFIPITDVDIPDSHGVSETPDLSSVMQSLNPLINGALQKYPELMKVLQMRLDGKNNQAIAAVLNIPVGTVKSRMDRIRKILNSHPKIAEQIEDVLGASEPETGFRRF